MTSVAELFERFESTVLDVTMATFVSIAGAGALITMLTVAVLPLASPPRVAITAPLDKVDAPGDELADINVTPDGRRSKTVASDTLFGPLLVTVIVYVRLVPTSTGFGEPSRFNRRSADRPVPSEIQRTPP